MNVPIFSKKRRLRAGWMLLLALTALLLFGSAVAFAESGGGHGEAGAKGWVATDTYRVMNFSVLAIGLFLVLKKPVSQALGGRIQGIKEQLAELEAKKKEAEAKLAEYDAKMADLDKASEAMLAEYLKQGEDAKARILKEAEAGCRAAQRAGHQEYRARILAGQNRAQGDNRGKGPGKGRGDHQGEDQLGRPGKTGG